MKKSTIRSILILFCFIFLSSYSWSQTSISGKITESKSGDPIPGVNIKVIGTNTGTVTDINGNFSFTVSLAPPLQLEISSVGYTTQRIDITNATTTDLSISMEEETILWGGVVVSASRVPENILKSPVTVEKLDILDIQQASAPDFFDRLNYVKGVQSTMGSLTFNAINTRGFATIANTRFVTLVDGMDISAPLLNFPTGNLVGISDLDVESVELVPGAASALYGPNAFNGILFMNSKSPFDYQGLSAQTKLGYVISDAGGSNPLYNFEFRYAKAFRNKLAFKVNFSILQTTDWTGNDYTHDRVHPQNKPDAPNFDGLNLFGDETAITIPLGVPFWGNNGNLDLRRTGWKEEDLLDSKSARSLKADAALHYRITDKIEALYNYRFGGGRSIYQGSAKYALRDFTQQFHKLEIKSPNFFVRGYLTQTHDGDSYNLEALGGYLNEAIFPTAPDANRPGAEWAETYATSWVLAVQGYIPGVPAGDQRAAHQYARSVADASRPLPGSPEFKKLVESVRTTNFQRNPPGASFVDASRLWHAEFNYNLKDLIQFMEIQVGGNFREYSIFSDGTIFDEVQNKDGSFQRVKIKEYGGYLQLAKQIGDLKLNGSIRYDKNENFKGQINPRVAVVYTIKEKHNLRASFQTGFRNPDTQSLFIWFPTGDGILVGSAKSNAEQYGLHNGGAYTKKSVETFLNNGGSFASDGTPLDGSGNAISQSQAGLVVDNFDYVSPEQLQAFEIGYKGSLDNDRLYLDINYYHNIYHDFIAQRTVYNMKPVIRRGDVVTGTTGNVITPFRPYLNAKEQVTSDGIGLGVNYNLGMGYHLNGSYEYTTFKISDIDLNSEFEAGFNTPKHRFVVGFSNRNIGEDIGFSINYRWQDSFLWQSAFGTGTIPRYGTLDFQINKKLKALRTVIKLGATNMAGGDYRTNIGSAFVGSMYYVSLTYDEFLK